jgi:nicotinamidase-related amidase
MERYFVNKEEAVLLIIDIQEKLVPVMKYKDQVISKTNTLISVAQELNIPIVVTEQYPQGIGHTVSELKIDYDNVSIFEKVSFSGYTDQLKVALKDLGRKSIIVTGMETHVCVFQTVRDLLKSGYRVFLVGDAVCSRAKENYRNALSLMEEMGAVITNTETVFFDLLKVSGTPQFRTLLRLIK